MRPQSFSRPLLSTLQRLELATQSLPLLGCVSLRLRVFLRGRMSRQLPQMLQTKHLATLILRAGLLKGHRTAQPFRWTTPLRPSSPTIPPASLGHH